MTRAEDRNSTASSEPKVGIVIVNYNTVDDVRVCLDSVNDLDYGNFFAVVVDNDSTAPDAATLGAVVRERGHIFIQSPENNGFAAANNIGIHYCRLCDTDFIWLLNPDTVVDRLALRALVEAAQNASVPSAFGSKIIYGPIDAAAATAASKAGYQPGGRIWSAGGEYRPEARTVSMMGWDKTDDGAFDSETECGYLPGCSLFFPVSLLDEAGYMPEEFFMYFEETEWCRRMSDAGFALRYVPKSVVWHRFEDEKLQRPRTVYYYNRNELAFWYARSNPAEKIRTLWHVLSKKIPEVRRAEREAPDNKQRAIFAAHEAAYWDFLFGRTGRRTAL